MKIGIVTRTEYAAMALNKAYSAFNSNYPDFYAFPYYSPLGGRRFDLLVVSEDAMKYLFEKSSVNEERVNVLSILKTKLSPSGKMVFI